MNPQPFPLILCSLILALLSGCASYVTPGGRADLDAFAPYDIQQGFATEPTHPFPASIAAVRVQESGYSNYYLSRHGGSYGSGRYSVITIKEVEEQSQLQRVLSLPQVSGVVSLNRMLLPKQLQGDREIRAAASRLQADLVFLYTFDTQFFDKDAAKPLTVITLGFSPTKQINALTTASAMLLDTRTGYIYAAYETTEREQKLATAWSSRESADRARQETEKRAFAKLVDEFVETWPTIVKKADLTEIAQGPPSLKTSPVTDP